MRTISLMLAFVLCALPALAGTIGWVPDSAVGSPTRSACVFMGCSQTKPTCTDFRGSASYYCTSVPDAGRTYCRIESRVSWYRCSDLNNAGIHLRPDHCCDWVDKYGTTIGPGPGTIHLDSTNRYME